MLPQKAEASPHRPHPSGSPPGALWGVIVTLNGFSLSQSLDALALQCVLSRSGPELITVSGSAPVTQGHLLEPGCLGAELTPGKEHLWFVWVHQLPVPGT